MWKVAEAPQYSSKTIMAASCCGDAFFFSRDRAVRVDVRRVGLKHDLWKTSSWVFININILLRYGGYRKAANKISTVDFLFSSGLMSTVDEIVPNDLKLLMNKIVKTLLFSPPLYILWATPTRRYLSSFLLLKIY